MSHLNLYNFFHIFVTVQPIPIPTRFSRKKIIYKFNWNITDHSVYSIL